MSMELNVGVQIAVSGILLLSLTLNVYALSRASGLETKASETLSEMPLLRATLRTLRQMVRLFLFGTTVVASIILYRNTITLDTLLNQGPPGIIGLVGLQNAILFLLFILPAIFLLRITDSIEDVSEFKAQQRQSDRRMIDLQADALRGRKRGT